MTNDDYNSELPDEYTKRPKIKPSPSFPAFDGDAELESYMEGEFLNLKHLRSLPLPAQDVSAIRADVYITINNGNGEPSDDELGDNEPGTDC